MGSPARRAAGRYNALARHRGHDAPETIQAHQELKTVSLAEHIRRLVDAAPPLSESQRARLAALLLPAQQEGGRAA